MRNFIKSGGGVIRVAIAGIIIATIIVSFYYYLSHRFSSTEETYDNPAKSEYETVVSKDFISEYPDSPTKVVEWYNRILKLYYSDEVSNNQIEPLCDQARMLFDQEILDRNTRMNYVASVKQNKEKYQKRSKRITSSTVVDEIEKKKGRDDVAGVIVLYTVQEGSSFSSSYMTYNLVKDGAGKYKIHTYAATDEKGNPTGGGVL